jgi:hypothetical protein
MGRSVIRVMVLDTSEYRSRGISEPKGDEIILAPAHYKSLFGKPLYADHYKPWKRGVIRIMLADQTLGTRALHRRYRSSSHVGHDEAVVNVSTLRELHVETIDFKADVILEGTNRVWGRLRFYWDHPDDATRAGFKLGFVGMMLGVTGLFISILQTVASVCQ